MSHYKRESAGDAVLVSCAEVGALAQETFSS